MLPKRLRLTRAGFVEAATGKRAVSAHFSVTLRQTSSSGGVAAVISKKVARKAVDRHRLKRQIMEVLRPYVSPDCSIIVYARAGAPALPFSTLKQELTGLIGK